MKDRKVSFEVAVGSVNYNLVHKNSDLDKKLFYYPNFSDLYYGDKNSIAKVTKTEDVEYHDIRKLPRMLYKSNINFLEVLFSRKVFVFDNLYQALVNKREEIARMNLPYLFDACFKGMYERKIKEYLKSASYVNIQEMEPDFKDKVNKQLMVAYRVLDFLERYANSGFNSFETSISYDDNIQEDRKMKEFLFSIRNGEVVKNHLPSEIPDFLLEKTSKVECLKDEYKNKAVNEDLFNEINELVMIHVRKKIQEEL